MSGGKFIVPLFHPQSQESKRHGLRLPGNTNCGGFGWTLSLRNRMKKFPPSIKATFAPDCYRIQFAK